MKWLAGLALIGCSGGSHGTIDASPADGEVVVDGDSGVDPGQPWVLGYYVGYDIHSLPIESIDWRAISHIAFAPMTVKDDLTLDFSFDDQDGMGVEHAQQLATAAHASYVTALLMLGGAGAGANIATAASDANRPAFVARLLDAMQTLGYDGIDLDWEDSVDLDDLVALAADLRAAKPDIVLSYPAGTINGNYQTVDPRYVQLAASLDRFMVQTYYPSTAVAGQGWDSWFVAPIAGETPATPISVEDSLKRYQDAGIPSRKLGFGLGAYAICYTGGITGPHQPTDSGVQIVGGDNAYPLRDLTVPADARRYDGVAQQPYLTFATPTNDPHCGAPTQYIAYEDTESIDYKATFMRAYDYGGMIVWTLEELSPQAMTDIRHSFFPDLVD